MPAAVHPDLLPSDATPRGSSFRNEYEAGTDSHRRARKAKTLTHEDRELNSTKRRTLTAATRDAVRNFVRVGAAVRKHLDFVARHTVDFQTGDEGLDRDLEQWAEHRAAAAQFDVTGRHDLDRFTRLAEARRTIDGDFFAMKLADGRVQGIEADRIRNPDRTVRQDKNREWWHGIECDAAGRPIRYAISRRSGSSFVHERTVWANRLLTHVWWDTHFRLDACRGVSPFAPGLNDFIDEHETVTHAHAKVKLAQVFGLKVISGAVDGIGEHTGEDTDGDGEDEKYQVDLGKGPFKLELDPGEDIDVIEGKTGAEEVIELLRFVADLAILVLDLPPHFFDTARVNFHGGKVGTTLYLLSAAAKRRDVQRFLSGWMSWQLRRAIRVGELVLPRSITLDQVLGGFSWIPTGLPWFDRSREVRPTLQAIAGGVDTYSRVIQEQYGMSLERFLQIAKRDQTLIEQSGVTLTNFDKVIFLPGDVEPAE